MPSFIIGGTCEVCRHWQPYSGDLARDVGDGECTLAASVRGVANRSGAKSLAIRPYRPDNPRAGYPDEHDDCVLVTDRDFGCTLFQHGSPEQGLRALASAVIQPERGKHE